MSEPATLADHTLSELLEAVAAQTPAPGGGSSSAVACGLAAGLVEMSARFTLAREAYRAHHDRARAIAARAAVLREKAVGLAQHELTAFEPVLVVLRDPDAPDRAERLKGALSQAADSPMAIARASAEVAELGAEIARTGNAHLAGDAIAGALLAEAACRAAARLAELNLADAPDDPRLDEAAGLAARAAAAREHALG